MGRWETVNIGVRLQVESCLQLVMVTLNLHVYLFIYLFITMSHWSMTLQQWALAVSDQSSRFMSEAAARLPSLLSERADLSKC